MSKSAVIITAIAALLALIAGFIAVRGPLPANLELRRSARLHHPAKVVWPVILDIESWAGWRTDLTSLTREGEVRGHAVWRETRPGESVALETVEVLKDRRLVRCVHGADAPFGGCITVEMLAREDMCIVSYIEGLRLDNAIFRFTHTIQGRRHHIDEWLTALAAKFGDVPELANEIKELTLKKKAAE